MPFQVLRQLLDGRRIAVDGLAVYSGGPSQSQRSVGGKAQILGYREGARVLLFRVDVLLPCSAETFLQALQFATELIVHQSGTVFPILRPYSVPELYSARCICERRALVYA